MPTPASHVWKPSHARVATIDSFVAVPRGTTAVAPAPLNWPTKDPGDVLDYILDITPAVIGNDGDGIATLDVGILPSNPGDLVMQSSTADGTRIVLWLSGGQAGTVYSITFNITTTNGRSLQRSVLLPVLLLSIPEVPADALLTSAGIMLTDQNGNPLLISS
ncbi:phage fiber-tail adaptor protein [Rhodopila globiformis]|uniref:phage fiber-tail adaptor protein n=1 Tax=Rhodopila globiformis TaxID=1071 RepID=UPI0011AFF927|nr:hypothetical protein [Rhodopila globiformis]